MVLECHFASTLGRPEPGPLLAQRATSAHWGELEIVTLPPLIAPSLRPGWQTGEHSLGSHFIPLSLLPSILVLCTTWTIVCSSLVWCLLLRRNSAHEKCIFESPSPSGNSMKMLGLNCAGYLHLEIRWTSSQRLQACWEKPEKYGLKDGTQRFLNLAAYWNHFGSFES